MGLLDGHRAIVTGGGSGMGKATALRMATEGARVAVFDQNGEAAIEVAREVGGHAHVVDMADWDQVSAAVEEAAEIMGGVSILHNNAGISTNSGLDEIDPAEFRRIVEVNLMGTFSESGPPHQSCGAVATVE